MTSVSRPRLLSVNTGHARPVPWGTLHRSAIDKRPIAEPVRVRRLGLDGDEQADRKHHGGIDQAVYAVAREDLEWWAEQLGRELRDGIFGENLTTAEVDVTGAVIGEHWLVGSTVLEVSAPRIPCSVFQGFLGEERWVRRYTEGGRPGAYLRVVREGTLQTGDLIEVVDRPPHGLTISETFRALTGERSLAGRLVDVPQLPEEARAKARQLVRVAARQA
jgi:MOSC domain-containing protein YiiM